MNNILRYIVGAVAGIVMATGGIAFASGNAFPIPHWQNQQCSSTNQTDCFDGNMYRHVFGHVGTNKYPNGWLVQCEFGYKAPYTHNDKCHRVPGSFKARVTGQKD